jgi:hypothetical protein
VRIYKQRKSTPTMNRKHGSPRTQNRQKKGEKPIAEKLRKQVSHDQKNDFKKI